MFYMYCMYIERVAGEFNERESGNVLHSLGKIVTWKQLPPSLQAGLLDTLARHAKQVYIYMI